MKQITILILIVLLQMSCNQKQNSQQKNEEKVTANDVELTEAQTKTSNIEFGKLQTTTISNIIRVNGQIDVPPQNLVSVSVPLGGYLKSTLLLPGMHLQKGEVIAILEDQQYIQLQQDYLITKAKLEVAEADYSRQKLLNTSKATSDKILEQAKAEYITLRINLSALAEKLKLININPLNLSEQTISKNISIYAPFDGYVSKVNVNIGKYVAPVDVIFELVNPSDIHLNLKVFEKDLIQLNIGQKLVAYTNSNPNKKFNCEIILISKDISQQHTAEVHCHFKNYDKNLLPGMYMNAEIDVQNQNVIAINEEAIVSFSDKNYLFISDENNRFKMIEAQTGDSQNGYIQILNSEVFVNKKIVIKGAYSLLMTLKNKSEE